MVFLRKTIHIGLIAVLLVANSYKLSAQSLTVEQEQQFTYYWYAAKEAIAQEQYPEALVLLEFCRMIKPNDGQTLTFLAILYNGMGQKERALQTFKEAFEASPRDQWQKYSYMLLDQRTPEGIKAAQEVMEKAYAAQKTTVERQKSKDEGQKSKVERQKTKDKSRKSKVERQAPNADEDLIEQLRRLYMNTGQWAKAIEMQDEMDQIRGFDAYSAVNRFRAYAAWGKSKKAMEAVDKYLELEPNNVQFLLFKMEIMEHLGAKPKELYAMYERILALDPMNGTVLNNYAYHLATHGGDLQKAERMSAISIREEPSNAVFLDTYGWILHMQGQNELALFYLKRALGNTDNEHVKKEIEEHIRQITK